ncbi:MAG: transglutaminase domain-containing protein [Bifidobacterium dentium]
MNGDYPSRAGHGNYRIDQLLAGTAMVGDSEQYVSTMALMARSLGLSSRVVLGFLPKNEEGDISEERTERHGKSTTTEFTGNDVTAWVEIKLDGYGWVSFYPTPKETKVPDENQNLTPPNPQTLVRQPPVPLTDPLRDDNQAKGKTSLGGSMADETPPRACSGSVSAESSEKSPSTAALCGRCSSSAACCSPSSRSPWLGRAGMAAHRNASLPDGRAVAALARQSGLDVQGTETSRRRPIAEQMGFEADTCSRWAGRLITRPSPEAMSRRSMRNATGMTSPKNESSCSARCRRSAGGGRNYRLRTFPLPEIRLRKNRCERAELMNVKHIEVGLNSNIGLRRKDNQTAPARAAACMWCATAWVAARGGKQASSDVAERFARLAELPTRDLDAIDETLILAQQEVLVWVSSSAALRHTTISGVRAADACRRCVRDMFRRTVTSSMWRFPHVPYARRRQWRVAGGFADVHHPRPFGTAERHRFRAMLPDEASRCIPRNIITQCVGAPAGIQPDWYAARCGRTFIICSDGLHAQIGRELRRDRGGVRRPQMAADMLVHAALNAGGRDNITVIVVDMRSDMPCDEDWNVSKRSAMTRISTMRWTVRRKRYESFNKMVTDHETRRS